MKSLCHKTINWKAYHSNSYPSGRAVASSQSRVGNSSLSSIFPQILIIFSWFSSIFSHFLPHFGSPGGRPAWLRYCLRALKWAFFICDQFELFKKIAQARFSLLIQQIIQLFSLRWLTTKHANENLKNGQGSTYFAHLSSYFQKNNVCHRDAD